MNTSIRVLSLVSSLSFLLLGLPAVHAQPWAEDFEDGALTPFNVEKVAGNISEIVTPAGFPARAGSKVHRFVWYQANYDGTRTSKSVEGTSTPLTRITSEGWYGFSFYAPESFPVPGKTMVLGQIHAWHSSLPLTNITCTLGVEPGGALILEGAYGTGDGNKITTVYATVSSALKKGQWHDVVLYVKFSKNNTGAMKAWFDGAPEANPTVSYSGINLGNGAWTNDTLMTNGAYIKWGPYCWDAANYTAGESREIFYDEITYTTGNAPGSFDVVKPSGYGTGYPAPATADIVMQELYDGLVTGSQPSGWSITAAGGTNLVVREVPSATNKSMQFWDSSATGRCEGRKSFASQSAPFSAKWSFRQTGTSEGHRAVLRSGNLEAIEIRTTGGNLVYRDGAGVDRILQAVPANTWYDVQVFADPVTMTADVYVNGARKLTRATFRYDASSFDGILFGTSDASATYHYYIDSVVIAKAPKVLDETFDTMTTGGRPSNWLCTATGGTNITIRDTPSVSGKSMQFYDASATGAAQAIKPFMVQTSPFTASWSFMQTGSSTGHRMQLLGGSLPAVEMSTDSGNLVYKNTNGSNTIIQAIPAGIWYEVKVVVRPGLNQADVYVNGVLKRSNAALRNPVTFVDRFLFGSGDAQATYHMYMDNIRIESSVPPLAPLAANIPRVPIVLKLDDLNTGGGNVPNTWRRVTDFAQERGMKVSIGIIAKSLEVGNASYVSYIQGLRNAGVAEFWFHGYDHSETPTQEFNGSGYTFQKNHFTTSQSLAVTKLGFPFSIFGAPYNSTDANTVQVLNEDSNIGIWLYGDSANPAGKTVLKRVPAVNIEEPTFVPNPEKFLSGYLANVGTNSYFVIQGHPGNWSDARWADFVRLIDYLEDNGFPIVTATELADSL